MSFYRRGLSINAGGEYAPAFRGKRDVNELLSTIENIYHIRDLDTLLEKVLFEARRYVNADAGTLYMKVRDKLYFSYVQNDTLFTGDDAKYRYIYASNSLPLDKNSLAGYSAITGESILIDDVYDIKSNINYSFNPEFDVKSSYRTTSMLIVPLLTRTNLILGVLQLINAKDETGMVTPFSGQDRLYITHFAQNAANAIEKAKLNREMVLRMVELSELRDPFETSPHAKRVGAYAVELYEKWADLHNFPAAETKGVREFLMTAAMLHDVGKVAISDTILRKTEDLTEEERDRIKLHTIYGARLFRHADSPWDKMAAEVALNHHENWDGTGYPGKIEDIHADYIAPGTGKKEMEIPISARIVRVVDVFDSLISKRVYKEAWEEQDVIDFLKWQAEKQFDPELVELFLGMKEVIESIKKKFLY